MKIEITKPDFDRYVFDNSDTMCREAIVRGKVIAHISAKVLLSPGFDGFEDMPFYFNVGPWTVGKIW